jgi:hypothetical protein
VRPERETLWLMTPVPVSTSLVERPRAAVAPYCTSELPDSLVVQVMVALPLPAAAVTEDKVGALVSNV